MSTGLATAGLNFSKAALTQYGIAQNQARRLEQIAVAASQISQNNSKDAANTLANNSYHLNQYTSGEPFTEEDIDELASTAGGRDYLDSLATYFGVHVTSSFDPNNVISVSYPQDENRKGLNLGDSIFLATTNITNGLNGVVTEDGLNSDNSKAQAFSKKDFVNLINRGFSNSIANTDKLDNSVRFAYKKVGNTLIDFSNKFSALDVPANAEIINSRVQGLEAQKANLVKKIGTDTEARKRLEANLSFHIFEQEIQTKLAALDQETQRRIAKDYERFGDDKKSKYGSLVQLANAINRAATLPEDQILDENAKINAESLKVTIPDIDTQLLNKDFTSDTLERAPEAPSGRRGRNVRNVGTPVDPIYRGRGRAGVGRNLSKRSDEPEDTTSELATGGRNISTTITPDSSLTAYSNRLFGRTPVDLVSQDRQKVEGELNNLVDSITASEQEVEQVRNYLSQNNLTSVQNIQNAIQNKQTGARELISALATLAAVDPNSKASVLQLMTDLATTGIPGVSVTEARLSSQKQDPFTAKDRIKLAQEYRKQTSDTRELITNYTRSLGRTPENQVTLDEVKTGMDSLRGEIFFDAAGDKASYTNRFLNLTPRAQEDTKINYVELLLRVLQEEAKRGKGFWESVTGFFRPGADQPTIGPSLVKDFISIGNPADPSAFGFLKRGSNTENVSTEDRITIGEVQQVFDTATINGLKVIAAENLERKRQQQR